MFKRRLCLLLFCLYNLILASCDDISSSPILAVDITSENTLSNIPTISTPKIMNVTPSPSFSGTIFTPTITQPPSLKASEEWEYNWLKKPSCSMPCWENIRIGNNNFLDVENILKSKSFITKISNDNNILYWRWKNYTSGGAIFFNSEKNNVVEYIKLVLPKSIKLSDIIALYGEPTYVIATAIRGETKDNWQFSLRIIFNENGIMLYNTYAINSPNLEDTSFYNITFFDKDDPTLFNEIVVDDSQLLVKWQGYNSFIYYCRGLSQAGPKPCSF